MNRKGFTLIEILAVISIMALLCVVMIPQIINLAKKDESKISDVKINLIKQAADMYVNENIDKYPTIENNKKFCISLDVLENEEPEILVDIEDVKKEYNNVKVTIKNGTYMYSLVDQCQTN